NAFPITEFLQQRSASTCPRTSPCCPAVSGTRLRAQPPRRRDVRRRARRRAGARLAPRDARSAVFRLLWRSCDSEAEIVHDDDATPIRERVLVRDSVEGLRRGDRDPGGTETPEG